MSEDANDKLRAALTRAKEYRAEQLAEWARAIERAEYDLQRARDSAAAFEKLTPYQLLSEIENRRRRDQQRNDDDPLAGLIAEQRADLRLGELLRDLRRRHGVECFLWFATGVGLGLALATFR